MVDWNGTQYYAVDGQGWITQLKPWFKNKYGLFGAYNHNGGEYIFNYPGTYTFYFGVDTIQNDTFMDINGAYSPSLYYDYVKIVVK